MAAEATDNTTKEVVGAMECFNKRKDAWFAYAEKCGRSPYPNSFDISCTIEDYLLKFAGVVKDAQSSGSEGGSEGGSDGSSEGGSKGDSEQQTTERLGGRIRNIRNMGKVAFVDIESDGFEVQLMLTRDQLGDTIKDGNTIKDGDTIKDLMKVLHIGAIVGAVGVPYFTKSKKPTLKVTEIIPLVPCLQMVPTKLEDTETRYRMRYLDFIVNPSSRRPIKLRHQVLSHIRDFFNRRDYIEVETPCINPEAGGAAARPFKTHVNDTGETCCLRVSPELALKMLVVGGFPRVYEIGRQFRNEGLDGTHNPEFTSIETYCQWSDWSKVMELTEELLVGLVRLVNGGSIILNTVPMDQSSERVSVDFSRPFKRVPMIETLEQILEVKFPRPLNSEACNQFLIDVCESKGLKVPSPPTTAKILDFLTGEFIEPKCVNPTFITGHPEIMSPLAKRMPDDPELTERFELFITGKEFCNAYTELNNPFNQHDSFLQQANDRAQGDDEAQVYDAQFVHALDLGLPPTGGWGMGIDRLIMLLAGTSSIKEVLAFPMMKKNPHFAIPKFHCQ